ncbi:hypothetical protein [Peribacillus sp. FSL M8-0224]|uniref:hypothetical protein n=1 Tax=Peribacillus sp. FSL M8-0224 TaxID=2921568 RepID=UPI0030F7F9BA
MTFGNAETNNDWIGFFGSYIGALIGAAVAVIVSRIQANSSSRDLLKQMDLQAQHVKERIDNEINSLKLSNRVFIDYTMDFKPLLLSDKNEDENKILLPRDFYLLIKHNPNDYLEKLKVRFIKLEFYGATDCVLDIKIKMRRSEENAEEEWDYMYLAGWRKGDNIFIPVTLHSPNETRNLLELEIEYTTLLQERIRFVSDLVKRRETYLSIVNGSEQIINERELLNEQYILPGNKLSQN